MPVETLFLVPSYRNGECINLIGGFECLCPEGQEPNESHECVDLDECARDRNICPNGECVNTEAGTKKLPQLLSLANLCSFKCASYNQ